MFKSRVVLRAAVDLMAPSVRPNCRADSAEDKVAELSEEDVSYMGDELDLKTVGDIIAIIEDKVKK